MIVREPEFFEPVKNPIVRLGRSLMQFCREMGRAFIVTLAAFGHFPHALSRRNRSEVAYQMFFTGIRSLGVITVVALFTGMIFALQTGIELRRYGQEEYVGGGVTVTMLREMGPFMTAMIIAASVGSSIAAQLGTMTVSEEVAALEIMSISPARYLVMPRLLALCVMMPLLTFYTNIVAILGGAIVAQTQLGVSRTSYFFNVVDYADVKDLYVGLLKAFIFGVVICTIACHQGFSTKEGAVGVGKATRQTVVSSFLLMLMLGYMITKLFYT